MTQNAPGSQNAGISLTGGAAILAPITAFPNGVPGNALVLIPLGPNGAPVDKDITKGPVVLQMEEVWKLLGFNGPAVQRHYPQFVGWQPLVKVKNPDAQ